MCMVKEVLDEYEGCGCKFLIDYMRVVCANRLKLERMLIFLDGLRL